MDLNQAQTDPGSQFKHPREILALADVDDSQKIAILRQWDYDIREMMVAEEENMLAETDSNNAELLRDVHKALHQLGAGSAEGGGDSGNDAPDDGAPTKQG